MTIEISDFDLDWLSDGLRFQCTGCGKCCSGASGTVLLSQPDLERLAAHLGMQAGRFVRQYTRSVNGRRILNNAAGSSDCVFLKDRTCNVYDARPTQCRAYPWWLTNIRDEQSWQEAAAFCEGITHPAAPVVPATEVLAQCQLDLENEAISGRP
jgi:Fe-S-cluster containining protein